MPTCTVNSYQEGLFRHSVTLLIAAQTGNLCNLLFQVLMMRRLSVAEYGVLASMLSLVLVVATPLEALRTAAAHQTAMLIRAGHGGDSILLLLKRWAATLLIAALLIFTGGSLISPAVAAFFHLPDVIPVLLTALIMAVSLFNPLFTGALQGAQSFIWMAVQGQAWFIIRFAVAIFLVVYVGQTAVNGLIAHVLGISGSIALGIYALHYIPGMKGKLERPDPAGWNYFLMSLIALSGYAVIMNADIPMVKRFFEPDEAGIFARAATIGRSVIFLTIPVAAAMFPKVVSSGISTMGDRRILVRALLYTSCLIVVFAALCTIAAAPIWYLFTGEHASAEVITLVRWMVWSMAPLGMTFVMLNYEMAQRRFLAPSFMVVLAVIYVSGVSLWHETYAQVLTILTAATVSSMIVMGVASFSGSSRR